MGLLRGKIRWTIPGAGTAFTVLHFSTNDASTPTQADADEVITKMQTFATSLAPRLPAAVSLQVQNEVEEIVETSGAMLGVYTGATQTAVPGSVGGTITWAAAAGAVITWNTGGVRNGRRVRGRSFIVPVASSTFATDGTIDASSLTALNTSATNLRAAGTEVSLTVYARPTAPGATDGATFSVVSHRVPDMCAILTSRRS